MLLCSIIGIARQHAVQWGSWCLYAADAGL